MNASGYFFIKKSIQYRVVYIRIKSKGKFPYIARALIHIENLVYALAVIGLGGNYFSLLKAQTDIFKGKPVVQRTGVIGYNSFYALFNRSSINFAVRNIAAPGAFNGVHSLNGKTQISPPPCNMHLIRALHKLF